MIAAWYAARAHRLARDLRDLRYRYDRLAAAHHVCVTRDLAHSAALTEARERIADLELHAECLSIDNLELEKVNEALRGGLMFFDPSQGGAA